MFSTPISNDTRFFEALVLGIDSQRDVCKILTSFNQSMSDVPWVSSIYESPVFGDRVFVSTAMGYPIIVGILPRIGEDDGTNAVIEDGSGIDTGNYSSLNRGLVNNPSKPSDIVSGDRVVSNDMNGIYGLLRGGSFIARASRMAQILLSKFDELARIVARNYELFTDFTTDIYASVRGRVYRFVGYSHTLSAGRADTYKYQELYGDTVLGDSLKWNYYGLTPSTFSAQPASNAIIRKYRVVDGANTLFYQDLYHDTGRYYTRVQNSAGTTYTYLDHVNNSYDLKSDDGTTFTRVQATPGSMVVTFNGPNVNKITVNNDMIELSFNNGAHYLRVNSTGVHQG